MNRHRSYPPAARARGFTLIELLVTITIITMLAGIALGAIYVARGNAREQNTKAVIAELDVLVQERYHEFRTRRAAYDLQVDNGGTWQNVSGVRANRLLPPKVAAQARLDTLRDLMRMEMPERWSDIEEPPIWFERTFTPPRSSQSVRVRYRAPLSSRARRLKTAYSDALASADPTLVAQFGQAECLYMFLVLGDSRVRTDFSERQIGDVDEDGLPEFIDGYGRPIMFLRWAPGFNDSEIQFNYDPNDAAAAQEAAKEDHDPFDSRRIEPGAYRLVPLIYSGGPDKEYGILSHENYTYNGDPYANVDMGAPITDPTHAEYESHFDNIHNHRIEAR